MNKKICFAGFGEPEIQTLQPALATVADEWDCVFVPDADAALITLATAAFDAVVTNLTPEGINDTELLQQTAVRHPQTLRLVLGDVTDRKLIVNCMGAAQQFISRPWTPEQLISILERSLALDAWLSNDKLRAFVPRLGKLPSLPATYFEVLKKAESPNSSVESIAAVIAKDPALTARLLQMVNSPACGLIEKITSPTEAVSVLGVETVKSLVLCLQLFAHPAPAPGATVSLDQLWRHSFSVAKLAAAIIARCEAPERMASDAYTAGLLHNIGQIVLATNLSREYSAVVVAARKRKCPLHEVELEMMGVTSNQVGAYLLGLWVLTLPVVEATAHQYAPALAHTVEFSLLTVVHVANVLANETNWSISGLVLPRMDAQYLDALNLPRHNDAWRKLLAAKPATGGAGEQRGGNRRSSSAKAETRDSKPILQLAMAAAVVMAIVIGAVVLTRHPVRAAETAPPTVVVVEQAASAKAETDAKETTASTNAAFDAIKLQGIIISAGRPVAMINGKTVEIGDRLNGVEVVSIGRANVVLSCGAEKRMFKMK